MERRVFEAALEGDVATLKRLLHEDPLILDRTVVNIYSETPLHVAAMLGYHDFAREILKKKPELAKELNSKQSSPLHLAAAKGHVDVVKAILLADPRMCRARDRDGLTPVHLAAIKGRLDVLKELIDAISRSGLVDMMAMDDQRLGESILHMCVKHSKLEALKTVVEMIGDGGGDFVNYRDAFGNTILHLAVTDKQTETVKFLLLYTTIEVNAQNLNGLTAMDILLQTRNDVKEMDIAELLRHKGAKQASKHISDRQMQSLQSQPSGHKKSHKKKNKRKKPISNNNTKPNAEHWVQKMRDALMVAASLLATMAFQAVVSPPGGLLQNDTVISKSEIHNNFNSFFSFTGNSESYVASAPAAPSSVNDTKKNATIGKSVMSYYKPPVYSMFLVANTTSFLASLSIILLLISGLPLSRKFFMYIMMIIMWVAITGMGVSYFFCINMITPEGNNMNIGLYLYRIGACLLAGHAVILVLGHTIQMTIKMIKWLCRAFKRKPKMNSSSMDIDSCEEIYVA